MSFQMKSKILICIFLFAWVKIAVGQGLTNVEKARSLNGQTSRLLVILLFIILLQWMLLRQQCCVIFMIVNPTGEVR